MKVHWKQHILCITILVWCKKLFCIIKSNAISLKCYVIRTMDNLKSRILSFSVFRSYECNFPWTLERNNKSPSSTSRRLLLETCEKVGNKSRMRSECRRSWNYTYLLVNGEQRNDMIMWYFMNSATGLCKRTKAKENNTVIAKRKWQNLSVWKQNKEEQIYTTNNLKEEPTGLSGITGRNENWTRKILQMLLLLQFECPFFKMLESTNVLDF